MRGPGVQGGGLGFMRSEKEPLKGSKQGYDRVCFSVRIPLATVEDGL